MSTVFYTSDLHIGHEKVAAIRAERYGFSPESTDPDEREALCVEWHDRILAENWDGRITDDDTVIVLGDISVGGSAHQRAALEWVSKRPGVKHLIAGNHDGVHPSHRDAHKWFAAYADVFVSVFPFSRRKIAGREVLLSHYPYSGDHISHDRDVQYRLPDMGLPVLHGHTHSPERGDAHQIHIGVDAWYLSPVPQSAVEAILSTSAI